MLKNNANFQYQFLQINTLRIVWKIVKRITNESLLPLSPLEKTVIIR